MRARFERFSNLSSDPKIESKIGLQYGQYKVIYDRVLRRSWIYDTIKDPNEKIDLAKSHPQVLDLMMGRLKQWIRMQGWILQQLK